jgi:hypothetical protein
MTAKVLDSFGGKFAEQWIATLLTPAFVFWLGGFVATIQWFGWESLVAKFIGYPEPLQIAILVASFCIVSASAFVVQRFDFPALRFLEGYWYPWLRPLRQHCIQRYRDRKDKLTKQSNAIRAIEAQQKAKLQAYKKTIETSGAATLTPTERDEFLKLSERLLTPAQQEILVRLRQELREMPANVDLMPTRLGNVLRAAERKPLDKYGLDAIICWSRLWLLLPDAVKKDLQSARVDLDSAARVWLWSALFTLWSLAGALWAIPLGVVSAAFTYYYWAVPAARTYGSLIEAAFDLYRHLLYQSLRWDLPADPNLERQVGQQLIDYLWRGF